MQTLFRCITCHNGINLLDVGTVHECVVVDISLGIGFTCCALRHQGIDFLHVSTVDIAIATNVTPYCGEVILTNSFFGNLNLDVVEEEFGGNVIAREVESN